jgi:hypothetical protein
MSAVAERIMKRVRGKGRGWVFTPRHFVDFGARGAVDVALSRLVQAGDIRRIGRGLYDYPRQHAKLGDLSPDVAMLADALAAQTGDRLAPSGATAVNGFGLSTQVPARASFATSGPTRIKKVAGRSLTLRHSRVPVLDKASDTANSAIQGLAHLGKGRIDDDVIARFATHIDDRDMKTLLNARAQMPGWLSDVVLKIGAAHNG